MSHEEPTDPAQTPTDLDGFDAGFWTEAAVEADPAGSNIFTAEIENVNSSDWEMDPDIIWGDETVLTHDVDGGSLGADFAV
ncbi:hypothetical protein [Microbacterium sp. H83]|uniref:hypothetical protein n=1 Tax=Microbacterium sp. H83 TaxID=1827324 RepID=UPI0007F3A3FA|nr:hypothetical protein [Microbacterium sp. H83]OAN42129.1 hypothetical protein A4X16_10390 [Microbacterium sp. H83]